MSEKKLVLVLGSSGGLGREINGRLNEVGYRVVGTSSQEMDITSESSVEKFFSDRYFSQFPPFGLVNATGIFDDGSLKKMTMNQWDRVFSVNLRGAFLATKHFLRVCEGPGSIIQLGSVVTHRTPFGAANYTASKAGLLGLMRTAAVEGAKKGIRSNLISLGYCEKGLYEKLDPELRAKIEPKIPLGLVSGQSVTNTVEFCFSTDHLTGVEIVLDSGWCL